MHIETPQLPHDMDSEIKTARMHSVIVFYFHNVHVYELSCQFHSDGKSSFFKSEHFSRKPQTAGKAGRLLENKPCYDVLL